MSGATKFCRLCLRMINEELFEHLYNVEQPILNIALRALDLLLISQPIICGQCVVSLKEHFNFIMDCRKVEENLITYFTNTHAVPPVSLLEVLQFVEKTITELQNNSFGINIKSENKTEILNEESTLSLENAESRDIQPGIVIEDEHVVWIKEEMDTVSTADGQAESMSNKTPNEISLYRCNLCTYKSKRKYHLDRHTLIHKVPDEILFFQCELCPYRAKQKYHLKNHKLIHKTPNEISFFRCNLCTYKSKQKCNLKRHTLVHQVPDKISFFQCDLCPYKAKQKVNLETHRNLIHKTPNEILFFQCDVCPYKGKRKGNLKTHTLIHKTPNEILFFKCDVCTYKAKRKSRLEEHKLIHKMPK